ncbi:alpha/beta hydrolase domain-containing protein [Hymenopellis radicata]|nr:alpha/beta hydrolase domain-containing protein [Hymenopellis radicata]
MQRVAQIQEREIHKVLFPTVGSFLPLLEAKKEAILKTPKRTFAYGPTPRHKLDIYYPPESSLEGQTKILVFCYGGGFTSGSRTLPAPAELAYGNLGMHFSRQGFITIIPDYRLSPEVKHPEQATDIRDALLWVVENPQSLLFNGVTNPDIDSFYVMGHSAGAVNVFTMLALPELYSDVLHPKIGGVILFSAAYTYDATNLRTVQAGTVKEYFGGDATSKLPLSLLQAADANRVASFPRILLGVSQRDPQSFLDGSKIFSDALVARGVKHEEFIAQGHNHISVTFCLGTGEGEDWAADVARWISSTA